MRHNILDHVFCRDLLGLLRKRLANTRFSVLRSHFLQPKLPFGYLMLQFPKQQAAIRMRDAWWCQYVTRDGCRGKELAMRIAVGFRSPNTEEPKV